MRSRATARRSRHSSAALRRLERRRAHAVELIDPAIKAIDAALTALDEAGAHLDAALRAANHDPRELDRRSRSGCLFARGARANTMSRSMILRRSRRAMRGDLASLDAGAAELKRLEAAAREADAAYAKAARRRCRQARRKAAAKLDKAVNGELKPLRLERARFFTHIETGTGGPDGIDRIEFWVETNPGTRPGPLMKVASGGELARFMLALKVALADRGSAPTLIFDEIDTGVGGAVADAIGQRLARLGGKVQVVAVTHAPQVAARADHHYVISKDTLARGKRVATSVTEVAAERRREEIARMLAGAEITDEARKAAERLIKAAA